MRLFYSFEGHLSSRARRLFEEREDDFLLFAAVGCGDLFDALACVADFEALLFELGDGLFRAQFHDRREGFNRGGREGAVDPHEGVAAFALQGHGDGRDGDDQSRGDDGQRGFAAEVVGEAFPVGNRMEHAAGDERPAQPFVDGLDEAALFVEENQYAGDGGDDEGRDDQRRRPGFQCRFHDCFSVMVNLSVHHL